MPYKHLLDWVLEEYKKSGSIFGISKFVKHTNGQALPIFDEKIESPFGPAAGPNTQLAQNIIASYVAGSRFFELKTVQVMDGAELAACVAKPCITAHDECYNCEWSTELYVPQAYEEYVKAWFVCKILAKELGLGDPDGFVFNMSVGYDLEGIKTPKVNKYIEEMKDASDTEVFKNAMEVSLQAVKDGRLKNVDEDFIKAIGATPVKYSQRNECCGGYIAMENKCAAQKRVDVILKSAKDAGAEMIITACPLCMYNLDANATTEHIPVKYFTELLAEALGVKEAADESQQ
jgi:hypothetical protein